MSRRQQTSSEFSLSDPMKGLVRTAISYTNIPIDNEFFRDSAAQVRLSYQLSTRSGVSTASTLAHEYAEANKNPEMVRLVEIGRGQCGTIFSVLGTEEAIKVPNNPTKIEMLYEDAQIHAAVYDAFTESILGSISISIPRFGCWMNSKSKSWDAYRPSLSTQFATTEHCIVSQRIFPLPQPTREAIIDTFCPLQLQRVAKSDPKNKDCLIRVYLGRRQYGQKTQTGSKFSLRNFPLLVNDMEKLNLDTADFAKIMGSALAVLHWKVGVDGNDVEFVIGSKPFYRPKVCLADFQTLGRHDEKHAKYDIDFGRRVNHLWLLDFNECTRFSEGEDDWLPLLLKAFYFNDPYYPRPVSTDERDVNLWNIFREHYLDLSLSLTQSNGPRLFIDAVENRGKETQQKITQQGAESLFSTMLS